MIFRAAIAVVVAGSMACSDARSADKRKADPALVAAYQACGESIARAGELAPSERARAIARGCSAACPDGFARYEVGEPDSRLGGSGVDPQTLEPCRLFCNAAAAAKFSSAPVAMRYHHLAVACGLAYYELPEGGAWMMSDTWLVLLRTHEWLRAAKRRVLAADALFAVDEGTEHTHFQLPLPSHSPDLYTLPESAAVEPPAAAFYVVVGTDSITTAAVPVARLRDVIETRPVPGGAFPGTAAAAETLAGVYAEHESLLQRLHAHAAGPPPDSPLFLADRKLPAKRVIEVARALGRAEIQLGVAGNGAFAHKVRLRISGPSPTLTIEAASPPSPDALRAELAHLDDAPTAGVTIAEHMTVGDLVGALDLFAEVRIGSALVKGAE